MIGPYWILIGPVYGIWLHVGSGEHSSKVKLKFMFSKKATKIDELFTVDLKLYKGQLISKWFFEVINLTFTTMIP